MSKLNRLTETDRADLVAYLDGELEESQTQRIESILAQNPVARQEVEQLARTYELLDSLPRPQATEDFTEKTVATARIEEFKVPLSQREWYRQSLLYGRLGLWSMSMLACSAIGYWLTYEWLPQPDDVMLDHYPLIYRFDEIREVQSVEFLDTLRSNPELLKQIKQEARYESQ